MLCSILFNRTARSFVWQLAFMVQRRRKKEKPRRRGEKHSLSVERDSIMKALRFLAFLGIMNHPKQCAAQCLAKQINRECWECQQKVCAKVSMRLLWCGDDKCPFSRRILIFPFREKPKEIKICETHKFCDNQIHVCGRMSPKFAQHVSKS